MTKRNKIIYWIATLWLCFGTASFAVVQLFKLDGDAAGGASNMRHLGYPAYLLTLLGIWKVLAIVALLLPRCPVLKEWAYAGLFFTVTGAMYSHICQGDPFHLIIPSILFLILIAVSWYFRPPSRRVSRAVKQKTL